MSTVIVDTHPPYGEVFQREARPDFINLFVESEAA